MSFQILQSRPDRWLLSALVLTVFVVAGCVAFRNAPGEDLASSYVGCRMMVTGQASHLYSFDPVSFDEIGDDDTWQNVADAGGYTGALHPYVQTPLWAYTLQPLCRTVAWNGFLRVFTVLTMLCLAGCVWLTAKYWAPSFYNPVALIVVLAFWTPSQPFQYAAFLMQTHVLLIFLTVAGLLLAEQERWLLAGLLVACAAAVKITPAFFVLYWLLTKRWKAAAAMLAWSAVLWLVTVFAVGHQLTNTYLADLQRISQVLIIPMNNQSFAAWLLAHRYPADAVFDVQEFRMPPAVRLASTGLVVLFTLWGGWIDRLRAEKEYGAAPIGAMMALVAATVFAPIAWTHYSVILVMPVMLLLHENVHLRSNWIWVIVASIIVLNFRPISTDINHFLYGPSAIIRAQFYAWILTLVALALAAYLARRSRPEPALGATKTT